MMELATNTMMDDRTMGSQSAVRGTMPSLLGGRSGKQESRTRGYTFRRRRSSELRVCRASERANDITSQMSKKCQGPPSNLEGGHPTIRLASWPRHTGSTRVIGQSLSLRQICTSGQFCTAWPSDSLLWGVPHNAALQLCLFDYHWAPAGHSRRQAFTASPRICFPALLAYGSFWMRWFDQFL